jgi:Zn-dependent peptidase ImmA (M78 family)
MKKVKKMTDSKPNFQKVYINANEILVSSKIITNFPYSATKLIKEQSSIVCRSFDKAHKYNVDIEAFGSDSAVIMNLDDKYIIFYNQNEMPERIKFSMLHEFGHKVNEHKFIVTSDEVYGIAEVETNYFAAQLLMPEQILREFQKRGRRIDKYFLMTIFGVSEQAAIKRIENLNQITWERSQIEKEYDDIILNKYLSWINSIVPNNIDYLFEDDEERQNVREQWRYNY